MTEITPKVLVKLEAYNSKIKKCIEDAVRHYQIKLSDESAIISQATKASYIRDFILDNAMRVFSVDPNVQIIKRRNMVVFLFRTNPSIVLKFKKFDKYNRVSYSKTYQAYTFTNQIEMFEDYGRTVNLHAGYKWNETATEIKCLIGYPDSYRGHAWTTYIPDTGVSKRKIETTEERIENIKPKVTLKINQIRKTNEKAS